VAEIRFYHLTRAPLERVLPLLLEKTLEAGARAVVMAESEERVEALNALLWTYNDRRFLPHGSAKDGHAERQPIWLTTSAENPNGATYLFLTDGAESDDLDGFERCFLLFDGRDETAVAAAREKWKALKDSGAEISYWQQDDGGRWQNKAL
jgi:DNA polymerase-3 subunit chi